jgi:8-oxo-dGTP pyrophosphatase MutT (NUDIX family)
MTAPQGSPISLKYQLPELGWRLWGGDMRRRVTARVLLMDPQDRILLLRGRFDGAAEPFWFTVGGGVEPGETVEQAAAREILEETGFTDAAIGPVLWRRESVIPSMETREPMLFEENYFLARTAGGTPSRAGWNPVERRLVDEIRWWSLGELGLSQEPIYPRGLARILPRILAGESPE